MDTKWRNRLSLFLLILLFTFGARGVLYGLGDGSEYNKQSYFQTRQFDAQLDEFVSYLGLYELNYMTSEEMKKEITVSTQEINEHRYRYGDLSGQISDIQNQYEQKIRDAELSGSKEIIDAYVKERDLKIEDIKNNFRSDDYVKSKIVKEKEEEIDQFYKELDRSRSTFENLKTEFTYYLKDTTTGKIYTNLSYMNETEISQMFNQSMLTTINYPLPKSSSGRTLQQISFFHGLSYNEAVKEILSSKEKRFEGQIGVLKASPSTSSVLMGYYDYQATRSFMIFYTLGSIFALIFSIYLYRRTNHFDQIPWEKIRRSYFRIPIDIRLIGFAFSALITFILLAENPPVHYHQDLYQFIKEALIELIGNSILVIITGIQIKLWYEKRKDWQGLKGEWRSSLLYKGYSGIKDVFLNRSMGTQFMLLLAVVFMFGIGATAVIIEPEVLVIYIPAFIIVGIPTLVVVIRRMGYFNRIVNHTSELAQGNSQVPDLPHKGKSALAILAGNVNILKNGVKTSQKEQAKSERLKTELITNVSHDLRTPLTSIITYTELLKNPNLVAEDRDAYIQIVDRKAKRLKVLIDDLFEASKMASGNIQLLKEKVDLVQLLQQALAEYNEAMVDSTLTFRVTTPEKPVYAYVDGQKLWRAFDNLIGNILKYSLENTRVYIAIKALNGNTEITFKNVTKYELGENIDELFERFKRGDTSRHTEGSGLGLAIAKSIVDLHGGDLDIEVDGDLFKITITLKALQE